MSEAMDEGDILQIARIPVDNGDTSIDIFKKFVDIGPNLLIQTLKNIIR
jgi:methionyl-tRNA formyltransferase